MPWTYRRPAGATREATRIAGAFLRDVLRANAANRNFRIFGPDETASNRLSAVFEATNRAWEAETLPEDDHLAPDGRVMEILSEHTCQGWLEGYLLTGRHGFFSCYEAFIHIVDSMFNQHAKWLKTAKDVEWRRPIASLNYLLTSHVWRQDHNGFSHQDPGFVDHVVNKKADIVRVYFPPDANSPALGHRPLPQSWNRINVIVAGKQPEPQWMDMDAAVKHCSAGIGIWEWASNDREGEPDVVMACCRRRADTGDACRGRSAAPADGPRPQGPGHQRRRPDDAAARNRASARPDGRGFRRTLHHGTSR